MTTESVRIEAQAKVIANLIIASGDILIEGAVQSMCVCGGVCRIAATGELKGGIRAAQLIIDAGATLEGTVVEAPSLALGKIDVDAAIRARPGTGPAAQIEFKVFVDPLAPTEPAIRAAMRIAPGPPPSLRVVR